MVALHRRTIENFSGKPVVRGDERSPVNIRVDSRGPIRRLPILPSIERRQISAIIGRIIHNAGRHLLQVSNTPGCTCLFLCTVYRRQHHHREHSHEGHDRHQLQKSEGPMIGAGKSERKKPGGTHTWTVYEQLKSPAFRCMPNASRILPFYCRSIEVSTNPIPSFQRHIS